MANFHTQTMNFHIAPIDRQFVGGLIGARGSKIKSTVSATGVQRISYDQRRSLFEITGGARACERALDEMSKQLSELISKKIQSSAKSSGIKYKKSRPAKETALPKTKVTQSKKRNPFEALIAEDGRTTEEIEEEKRRIKMELKEKKKQKKQKLENERKFIVGGISWADELDMNSEDEEDDDEEE